MKRNQNTKKKVVNEKEIHDLNKDTKIQESDFKQLKAKFDEMSDAMNREKKQQEKSLRRKMLKTS